MLPPYVKDKHLDEGVIDLVKNLNRVPGVFTYTTCEGHVYGHKCPLMPTKGGWVHVHIPEDEEFASLADVIADFTRNNKYFSLQDQDQLWEPHYTINADFARVAEFGECDLETMTARERKNYLAQARRWHKKHLEGWSELNKLVEDYIQSEIGLYPSQLPYRDPNARDLRRPCPRMMCGW